MEKWVKGKSTSERVLWIRGIAGRGKSTIASTVANGWVYRASCAILHFRRGQEQWATGRFFFAREAARESLVTEVKTAIIDCVRDNEDIAEGTPRQAVQDPLRRFTGEASRPCPSDIDHR